MMGRASRRRKTVSHRAQAPDRRGRNTRRGSGQLSGAGQWLLVVVGVDAAVAISIRVPLLFGQQPWTGFGGDSWVPGLAALLVVPVVVYAAYQLVSQQRRERAETISTAGLMDTVLATSREWLWATGPDGRFTFCGPACRDLVGYEPSELLGRQFGLVIDSEELAAALQDRASREDADAAWFGLATICRHRDGRRILVEVSGRTLRDASGRTVGFEGTARALTTGPADTLAFYEARARVQSVLAGRTLLTAFQPILSLSTGTVIGAEALTRFPGTPGVSPEVWFAEAAAAGLGVELEILALETALRNAAGVPAPLYVAVNLSPEACMDPGVAGLIQGSGIPARRIVLEVTERHELVDYAPLAAALAPFRAAGLRIAVDDAGAGFASMRHVLQLKPDLIKLDRGIIAGIDTDPG